MLARISGRVGKLEHTASLLYGYEVVAFAGVHDRRQNTLFIANLLNRKAVGFVTDDTVNSFF